MGLEPVYIWKVESYDPGRIREVVGRSMDEMSLRPAGRILVKPNTVIAHRDLFAHAFTRPEFLDGVLSALSERADPGSSLSVGERCGITIPTRYAFSCAGYLPVLGRHKARPRYFEEENLVEVPLTGEGRLRDSIYVAESLVTADFLVNCPKFKSHPWTGVTFSLKNYIGIQDDADRLVDHDHALEEKIADLQQAARPSLIAVDAIIGGKGRMLTPEPVDVGLVIVGRNPVAVDATCCRIMGVDPGSIDHVRLCAERGIGSLDEADISLRGDVGMDEARRRTSAYDRARIPVSEFFAGTPVTALSGPPPGGKQGYCWGGCPGASEESIDIIKQVQPSARSDIRKMHIVFGDCRGRDLDLAPGERAFFYGDCVRFDGKVCGVPAVVDSTYVEREKVNHHSPRSEDMAVKFVKSYLRAISALGRRWIVVRGCPVSVAEQVLLMSIFGRVRNPYFDPRIVFSFVGKYMACMAVRIARRLAGRLRRKRLPASAEPRPA